MKKINLLFLLLASIFSLNLSAQCSPDNCKDSGILSWYTDEDNGVSWPVNDATSYSYSYSVMTDGGETIGVTASLSDPFNRSIDSGNCGESNIATSTIDSPNDVCGDKFTYGAGYLTVGMNSETSDEELTIEYSFDTPIRVCGLEISDIDDKGLSMLEFDGDDCGIRDSYQDEVRVEAEYEGGGVNIIAYDIGSNINVSGNKTPTVNLLAKYAIVQCSGTDLEPDDNKGKVFIRTQTAITKIRFIYSNGPDDQIAEQANPVDGVTYNGQSNDHAIRISLFEFCIPSVGVISGSIAEDLDNDGTAGNAGDPDALITKAVTVTLFADLNNDGLLSAIERSVGPALIDSDEDGDTDDSAIIVTSSGTYAFIGVIPGNYIVEETDPTGYVSVFDGDNTIDFGTTVDALNSDQNDNLIAVSLDAEEIDGGNDFVDERVGSISGTVYEDLENNNILDKSITYDPAVTLSLLNSDLSPVLDSNGDEVTATTNGSGFYQFLNVAPGDYFVKIGFVDRIQFYERDDINDGENDTEESDNSTFNGLIPVSISGGTGESDTGNDFVVADFVLPVNLLSLDAQRMEKGVKVMWSTASEINNESYEIMHSANGKDFKVLGSVKGAGNHNDISDYTYMHINPSISNYYKLNQIDLDGNSRESGVVRVEYSDETTPVIYPNPTKNEFFIADVDNKFNGLKIYTISGKVVLSQNITHGKKIDVSELPVGLYLAKLTNESNSKVVKLYITQ